MQKLYSFLLSLLLLVCVLVPSGSLATDQQANDYIVVLLDASGSMDETIRSTGQQKIVAAKVALTDMIAGLDQDTQIGLLVMEGNVDGWAYPLGPLDKTKFLAAVKHVKPNHGTPLGTFMATATNALLKERAKNRNTGNYRLVILTDGVVKGREKGMVERFTPEIVGRGIKVQAIGLDMKSDHVLKTMVQFSAADDGDQLRTQMRRAVAEIPTSDVNASQAALDLIAPLTTEEAMMILQAIGTGEFNNTLIGQ
jgi:Ca-activated chloride channel homolog